MNDFTDLFYTLFSIVIFSFLLLQANSLILRNESAALEHEYEKTAITLAQSIIEEAKAKPFDSDMNAGNIPDDFTIVSGGNDRGQLATFDAYNGYTETVETPLGDFDIDVIVTFVTDESSTPPFEFSGMPTERKRITVQVTGPTHIEGTNVTLSYIKGYFQE